MNERLRHLLRPRNLIIAGVIVIGGVWLGWTRLSSSTATQTRYVTAQVEKGMFIGSLSGTGQVSADNSLEIKPQASGEILDIVVKEGQTVKKGDLIAKIDPQDAQKTIRDARQSVADAANSVASARLSLAKLKEPATAIEVLQAQDAVNVAQRAYNKLTSPMDADLRDARNQLATAQANAQVSSDGVTLQVVRNAYDNTASMLKATMPTLTYILSDADNVLAVDNSGANASFASLLSVLDISQKTQATSAYNPAKDAVNAAKRLTDALSLQNEDPQKIEAAMAAQQVALDKLATLMTYTSNALSNTITSATFSQSSLSQLQSTIQADRSTISSKQSSMISQTQSITQAKTSAANASVSVQQAQASLDALLHPDAGDVAAAQEKLKEAQQKLADVKAGATTIDIQLQQNAVDQRISALQQAQNKLADAEEELKKYDVTAPFDGLISKVSGIKGDQASSGSSLATLIATQQFADISLNEVDAAKVKTGDKVTLTFDAIDGLTIAGEVDQVSVVGTVTQGVVNYDVKIGFDTQDTRIRAGMSVSASIVTEVVQDAVLVPNSAIKTQGTQKYVLIMDTVANTATSTGSAMVTGTPRQQSVQIGSANDSMTVVTSGLSGGETVVTQTISSATKTTTTTTSSSSRSGSSSIRIPGLTTGGGGPPN